MEKKELANYLFEDLEDENLINVNKKLLKYLNYIYLDENKLSREEIQEKIFDYLLKVELYNKDTINEITKDCVKKLYKFINNFIVSNSRADKYNEKFYDKANSNKSTSSEFVDYIRVFISLYLAVIKNKHKDIDNFDFDLSKTKMNEKRIIASLIKEKQSDKILNVVKVGDKQIFKDKSKYNIDSFTFFMIIYVFCSFNELEKKVN